MISNSIFKYIVIFILISIPISGSSQNGINLFLDYARFRYDEEVSYLEIYYLINAATEMEKEEKVYLDLKIVDAQNDSLLATQELQVSFNKDQEESPSPKLGLVKALLPEGQYTLKMLGYVNEPTQRLDTVSMNANIKAFIQEKIMLSDVELCSNIIPNSKRTDDVFYKNTMEVIPNPTGIYTMQNPRLYYYVEMYNLDTEDTNNGGLQIEIVIADETGQIRSKKNYDRHQRTESLVEKGAFDISKLESGLYALIFAVTDTSANYSVYRRSQFYVDNPDVVTIEEENIDQKFMQSRYFRMDSEEADQYFAQASYIANKEEINIYNSLADAEGKKRFLFEFWQRRNRENPGYEDNYYERVEYASERFGSSGMEGWKTDMGRVYIVYGEPDQKERKPNTPSTNPYEVWYYYDIQGGVEFDFVDDLGFGQYKLVNSTHRNEIQEKEWVNWYVKK